MKLLTDLWLLARRRRDIRPGEVAVSYARAQWAMMAILIVLCGIEIAAMELLVPWAWLRHTLTLLGVLTLIPVLGLWAGYIVRPHVVGPDRLLVRAGAFGAVEIPLSLVISGVRHQSFPDGNFVRVLGGDRLVVSVESSANVDVRLSEPYEVALPKKGRATITSLSFYADDPDGAIRALARQAV